MTWITTVHEKDAEGELAHIYREIEEGRGKVSNIMRCQSLAPRAMKAHMDLYMELLFARGGLSRAERELIAVVVSVENGCAYCTEHHAEALAAWWRDPKRVARLREDPDTAGLTEREAALTRFARILTREPSESGLEGVEALRAVGLECEEILQATLITGYFNFVNRIAEGLGVEAPPDEIGGYRY
ncbi:MAG: peroxidase [Gemmatimonadales bacterium]|nr:MAG: peroxidase [Gemmatimonadales bacterium]